MRRAIKYLLWIAGSFFLLILLALLFTQTAFFREILKKQLISQSAKFISLDLEIDKLGGNFYNQIQLENVSLKDRENEVLGFQSLQVKYNLWQLLEKEISIDSILIVSPYLKIWQQQDSSWSFESYIIQQAAPEDTTSSKFSYKLSIPAIYVLNGTVETEALSQLIPKKIEKLTLQAGFSYSVQELSAHLQKFSFVSADPSIVLKEMSFRFNMNGKGMQLDDFTVRTSGSYLTAKGDYVDMPEFQADVSADRIDSSEVAIFLPGIHLKCSPSVKTSLKSENDMLSIQLELNHGEENIRAGLSIDSLAAWPDKNRKLPFTSKLEFSHFYLENWMDINDLKIQLNGTVLLEGESLLNPEQNTKAQASLTRSAFNGVYFKTFDLNGSLVKNTLNAEVNLSSAFGSLSAKAEVKELNTTQRYRIEMQTDQLNLEAFVPEMKHTLLNAGIRAEGSCFDPVKIRSHGILDLQNSTVYNLPVDSFFGEFEIRGNEWNLDTLFLQVPGIEASGSGRVRLDSLTTNTSLTINATSLGIIDTFLTLPVGFETLISNVTISGPFAGLKLYGYAEVDHVLAYQAQIGRVKAEYNVNLNPDSFMVNTRAKALDIAYQNFHFDSLDMKMNYTPEKVDVLAGLFLADTLGLYLESRIELGDTISVTVPALEAQTFISDYYLNDTLRVDMEGMNHLKIQNLQVLDRNNPDFILQLDGSLNRQKANSLQLFIRDLDLSQLNRFMKSNDTIQGMLNSEISLQGTLRKPELSGTFNLLNPKFRSYNNSALKGSIAYNDGHAFASLTDPEMGDNFSANITVPMDVYLDSADFVVSEPDSFEASVVLKNIDLHKYGKQFVPQDSVKGIINVELNGSGSIHNPQVFGNIRIDQALYQNKEYGIDFSEVTAKVLFDGDRVLIDTLLIQQKKGFLSVSGELAFDSSLIRGNLAATSLQADAKNFFLAQNRNYEVLIDAGTFLKTGDGKPEYGGKIKVLSSDIFLPALMKESGPGPATDVPMLLQAVNRNNENAGLADTTSNKASDSKETENIFMDRLRGRLNVEIPRNTWIRSDDMRLELSGDMEIVKTGPNFELFGSVEIIRGYYIFYGRKMNVEESSMTFEGGEEFDPTMNFRARYLFRGSNRQKRTLDLHLTGKLSDPTVAFKLDGADITENDGVSVLLFGTTSDQIGYSEQEGMIGAMSSQAVASLLSTQLSKTLGNQLKLDVIEITATENWQGAAFVVGKYITNDIFVIYERGFGEVDGDEITPETITVEYELNNKLFLRLQSGSSVTSGFDVILKFEEKQDKKK